MSALTLSDTREQFAELVGRLEPLSAVSRPVGPDYPRVEDFIRNGNYVLRIKDGNYVVRAELPGVDPAKDIDIALSCGVLTIKVDRPGKPEGKLRYGASVHSIALPADADEKQVQAVYDNGVLEVTIGLKDNGAEKPRRKISVMVGKHTGPS